MIFITQTEDLEGFCKEAQNEPYVTIDTEFMRETTYWPQLCLIQIALKNKAVAIDPLAKGIVLNSFFDLLKNPNVIKVFHSARQDIEIFYHLTGQIPLPLFDTQVAAMVCGFGDSVSYEVLVKRYAKVSLDKSSRYTYWGQRPLSEKQLAYALGDVTHLRVIYEELYARILKEDRFHWLEDELGVLTDPGTYTLDPYSAWQKIRIRSPKPRFLAILRELAAWREITAQKSNVPRGRVLKDEFLLDLAASAPENLEDIKRMRGIPSSFHGRGQSNDILGLIKKAQSLPLEDCPQIPKQRSPNGGGSALMEMLRLLLKIKAEKYHVAPKLIATVADLEKIALSSAPDIPALQGWRREIFGNTALDLKEGKVAFAVINNKITLIPLS